MLWKKVCEYARSACDMAIGKPIEQSVENNERADAIEHDDAVEKAEEEVRRLEQQLKEAKAELDRKQEEVDRFEKELPGIKPSEPPKKREAKYFLKKWRKACLWYGSIITPVVAALCLTPLTVTIVRWPTEVGNANLVLRCFALPECDTLFAQTLNKDMANDQSRETAA